MHLKADVPRSGHVDRELGGRRCGGPREAAAKAALERRQSDSNASANVNLGSNKPFGQPRSDRARD
jgi:hypothetical protein